MTKVLISAGEASGDFLGAELAKQIKKLDKRAAVIGFGGPKMRAAGIDMRLDPVSHAAMGYWEVVRALPLYLSLFSGAKQIIKKEMPDALVVIDSPSFHLPLVKAAKQAGVKKIIYYSTPQVWMSRFKRIYEIKKYVDLCIVILPFERELFRKHGIKAEYFGHPAAALIPAAGSRGKTREKVGIFPGSRNNEIKDFFEDILKTCELIKASAGKVDFILFKADTIGKAMLEKYTSRHPGLKVKTVSGSDFKERARLSAAITKSGTITLELALLGIPEAVVYKISWPSYFILRAISKGKYVSLPNILLKKEAVKEFVQSEFVPEKVAAEIIKILSDRRYAEKMKNEFKALKKQHGPAKDAVKNAAKAVLKEALA